MDHHNETAVVEDRYYRDGSNSTHNVSFAGCGFLGIYHIGVGYCIMRYAPQLFKNKPIAGVSAGAIAAVCLMCEVNMGCALLCLYSGFQWVRALSLQRSMISPACLQLVIDGGLSNNLLRSNRMTITVSPFAGDADICPLNADWCPNAQLYLNSPPANYEDWISSISFLNTNILFTMTNLVRLVHIVWPMTPGELAGLAAQGYADALRYLTHRGLVACRLHQTPQVFPTSKFASPSLKRNVSRQAMKKRCHSYVATTQTPILSPPQTGSASSSVTRYRRKRSTTSPVSGAGTHLPFRPNATDGDKLGLAPDASRHNYFFPSSSKSLDGEESDGKAISAPTLVTTVGGVNSDGIPFDVHASASVVGFYRPNCSACRQEMSSALASAFPPFLSAIITGDVQYHRPRRAHLTTRLATRTWDLFGRAINRLEASRACVDQLTGVVVFLEWIRDKIATWKDPLPSKEVSMPPKPPSSGEQNGLMARTNLFISNTQCHLSQPTLANRLQSAVMRSTCSLTDFMFQFNNFKMLSAEDCGLDLFSPPSPSPLVMSPFTDHRKSSTNLPLSVTTERVGMPIANAPASTANQNYPPLSPTSVSPLPPVLASDKSEATIGCSSPTLTSGNYSNEDQEVKVDFELLSD